MNEVSMVYRPMVPMDAASGTGLMGPLLKDLGVEHLEGVDLSSKMLQAHWGPVSSDLDTVGTEFEDLSKVKNHGI